MKDDKDWRERMGGNYPEDLPDTTAPRHLSVSINLEIIMFPEVQIANARTPPPPTALLYKCETRQIFIVRVLIKNKATNTSRESHNSL